MLVALLSIVAGALLGLSLAAPPGPMNAVIAEESVNRGWRAGFAAGLGAMTADALFFLLAVAGLVAFIQNAPTLRGVMVGIGGLLMFFFAYGAVKGAGEFSGSDGASRAGFGKAFALAVTNPYQITWWLTAGVGLLDPGSVEAFGYSFAAMNGGLTITGFFAGIVLWITAFPAALRTAGNAVDALGRVVAYGSGTVLVWFGVAFLWDAGSTLGVI
ncbi:LysE family transporter [Halodesulfurarchaeum sp. HSR-GB]|uniref:LysE family translocator n=1 Tax=Halodesulfurarchaeum sp. HSR-GB TaxID=3074077 RepID=UPI002856002D|nr:LysE family transporter [Halodesulfurarchaeum sp. HSR-GB]MDR5657221.1 LysE family transporter [Halodesulfurarchaeum sp. HSR-GB]